MAHRHYISPTLQFGVLVCFRGTAKELSKTVSQSPESPHFLTAVNHSTLPHRRVLTPSCPSSSFLCRWLNQWRLVINIFRGWQTTSSTLNLQTISDDYCDKLLGWVGGGCSGAVLCAPRSTFTSQLEPQAPHETPYELAATGLNPFRTKVTIIRA